MCENYIASGVALTILLKGPPPPSLHPSPPSIARLFSEQLRAAVTPDGDMVLM